MNGKRLTSLFLGVGTSGGSLGVDLTISLRLAGVGSGGADGSFSLDRFGGSDDLSLGRGRDGRFRVVFRSKATSWWGR